MKSSRHQVLYLGLLVFKFVIFIYLKIETVNIVNVAYQQF